MTLTQLRFLVAVVDADLNISLAAAQVNATQPNISNQIKLIEDELGFQIFVRKGKSLEQLTQCGEQLIERARAVLTEVHNIRSIAANHRNDTRGLLRIAATHTQCRFVLPSALARLKARYPDVTLQLKPGGEAEALAMLKRDQADVAIVSTQDALPAGDIVLPLFQWRFALIAPRDHPFAKLDRPVTLADLADTPLVANEASMSRSDSGPARIFKARGFRPNVACTARDADTIKTCVRAGLGVGILSELALDADDPDIVALSGEDLFPVSTSWAVLRRDRIHRDYVFELLSTLGPALTRKDILAALNGAADPHLVKKARRWSRLAA
jgi:DNA-binding transcriptional LysR family regulator